MNILFCGHLRVGTLVGGSVHIYEVMSRLSMMGHNIVSLGGDFLQNQAGAEAHPKIPVWRRIESRLLRWPIFYPFRGELSILGAFRYEVYVFLLALIALARRRGRIDIIYRRHNLFNTEYLLAKLFKIPLVKEVNGIVADEARLAKQGDSFSLRIIDRLERFNMPKADKIIVVAPKLEEILQKDYKVPGHKITVIPNGANTDLFRPMNVTKVREELNLRRDGDYICFVGSLEPWQGIEYVIRSLPLVLSECAQTRLLVVGDGQMKQELVELAEQVGVSDRVIFTGMVPYQKVPLYMNAGDVCVAPKVGLKSGYSPLKLCEYMACEKPVVASRASGLEIVKDSGGGILIEPKELQVLAAAIIKLLQNRELRKRMGEKGRKYVVENQSWESVAKKVADVCQNLIGDRSCQGEQ